MDLPRISAALSASPAQADRDESARTAAKAFEASFLAEMLSHTGVNSTPDGFGGGAGEDAFGSFLTEEYARLISERGGVGLAERIFQILQHGAASQ